MGSTFLVTFLRGGLVRKSDSGNRRTTWKIKDRHTAIRNGRRLHAQRSLDPVRNALGIGQSTSHQVSPEPRTGLTNQVLIDDRLVHTLSQTSRESE